MIKGVRFREDENEIQQAVERLKRLKNSADTCNFDHLCRKDLCNPTNDPWAPHVYVCNYGQTHVCLPGTCTLGLKTHQGEYVCPVSGLMLGVEESYTMKPEQQHWKRVKTPDDKKKNKTNTELSTSLPSVDVIRGKCESILEKLLFGREREQLNREALAKQQEHSDRQLNKEVTLQTRNNNWICQPILEFIKSNTCVSNRRPYEWLQQRDHQQEFGQCVHHIVQLWKHLLGPFYCDTLHERVPNAPHRPNVECLTVAMLYLMKTGNTNGLIPHSVFLNRHLPREKDLPRFHAEGARHLKPSKDLLGAFVDEAVRLKMLIQYEPYIHKEKCEQEEEHQPSTRGFWCKKCRHRFDDEEQFHTHEPCSLLRVVTTKREVEEDRGQVKDSKSTLQRRHHKQVKRVQKMERDLEKRMKRSL